MTCPFSAMNSTIASTVSVVYPIRRSARGIVWLTICIEPPPTSFLNLTSEKSGSMPVVSQSIMKPMVPVGASTDGLRVAVAVRLTDLEHAVPGLGRPLLHVGVQRADRTQRVVGGLVLAHHPLVRVGVAGCSPAYGPTMPASSAERRYEVPVISEVIAAANARPPSESYPWPVAISSAPRLAYPMPELAVVAGGLADRLGREVGEADRDVHRGDDQLDGLLEPLGVERVVVPQELQQVEAGQVAGAVVQAHVLRARVGRGDPAGLGIGVPVVDRVVVLDARDPRRPRPPGRSCRTAPAPRRSRSPGCPGGRAARRSRRPRPPA